MEEKVLLMAHTEEDGSLGKPALEALTAALGLGGELIIGLIGGSAAVACEQLRASGASKIYFLIDENLTQARYMTDASAAETVCKVALPDLVLTPATSRWNRVIAGVARRLGGRADTHVTESDRQNGSVSIKRWYYRQRMEASLSRQHRPWFVAIEPGCYHPWCTPDTEGSSTASEQIDFKFSAQSIKTTVTGVRSPASDRQTIRPDARLLFVAGAGWTKKQADGQTHADRAAAIILSFLDQSKASLGGSKSIVDLGGEGQAVLPFMSHLNQIGQTGSTPRHQKGLSTCCHGEEPHVVGWRFINERRAINTDPNCSWAAGKCDVLYVADAFKVMELVNELLKKTGAAASKKDLAAV